MKDTLIAAALVVAIAVSVVSIVYLGVARWQECRRVHPLWYCLTSK